MFVVYLLRLVADLNLIIYEDYLQFLNEQNDINISSNLLTCTY